MWMSMDSKKAVVGLAIDKVQQGGRRTAGSCGQQELGVGQKEMVVWWWSEVGVLVKCDEVASTALWVLLTGAQ